MHLLTAGISLLACGLANVASSPVVRKLWRFVFDNNHASGFDQFCKTCKADIPLVSEKPVGQGYLLKERGVVE